ncbi:hypothetical protein [Paenibacillus piri]|uniref:hypothetical protein n=1 Tax=Paenibacillus piri TaxID=2547395 RepID=UPI001404DBCE|nr:hypothetical protein [Paenibacillus piri]
MFAKMRTFLKDYFIPEQQTDYVYYPTEDGIFAYYYRETEIADTAADDAEQDTASG